MAIAFAACATMGAGKTLRADPSACGIGDHPWVHVEFAGDGWTDLSSLAVARQLRAGLEPQGLALCAGPMEPHPDRADPLAVIVLRSENTRSVEVAIEVQDGVTQKHVQRELDLTSVPADGRSLGIAVAADELLRASWIELALEDAPPSPTPPPPAVEHTVKRSLASSPYVEPSASRELEARAALDIYDLSARFLGADVGFRHFPSRPWGYDLSLGLRSIAEERADHGTIHGSALGAGAAGVFGLVHRKSFGAELEVGAWAMQVRYRSNANPGVEGRSAAEVAVYARAGLAAVVRFSPTLGMRLRAGAGLPLRSVSVLDENDVATGARGPMLFSTLGLAVGL